MVAQNFAPMNIKLNTDRQKQLFNELEQVGVIQKWTIELCLAINKNKWNTNIEIRGQQIAQGQLMRRIDDYPDHFDKRFCEHELRATVAAFFGRQKAAAIKLQQIDSRWTQKSCFVSFISKEIDEETDEEEEEQGEDDDDDEEDDTINIRTGRQERRCVFCKQKYKSLSYLWSCLLSMYCTIIKYINFISSSMQRLSIEYSYS
jgi:hypothetical protein